MGPLLVRSFDRWHCSSIHRTAHLFAWSALLARSAAFIHSFARFQSQRKEAFVHDVNTRPFHSISTPCAHSPTFALVQNRTHVVAFIFAMLYLSCNHVYRQVYDYGSYTLDVTGPMMLMVQKISGLAFSYYDSRRPRSQLTADQLDQIVVEKPSLLEFLR